MVNLSIQYNHFLIDGIIFYLCAFNSEEKNKKKTGKFLRDSLFFSHDAFAKRIRNMSFFNITVLILRFIRFSSQRSSERES